MTCRPGPGLNVVRNRIGSPGCWGWMIRLSAPTNASGTRPVSSITRNRPNTSCGYGSVPIAMFCDGSSWLQSISRAGTREHHRRRIDPDAHEHRMAGSAALVEHQLVPALVRIARVARIERDLPRELPVHVRQDVREHVRHRGPGRRCAPAPSSPSRRRSAASGAAAALWVGSVGDRITGAFGDALSGVTVNAQRSSLLTAHNAGATQGDPRRSAAPASASEHRRRSVYPPRTGRSTRPATVTSPAPPSTVMCTQPPVMPPIPLTCTVPAPPTNTSSPKRGRTTVGGDGLPDAVSTANPAPWRSPADRARRPSASTRGRPPSRPPRPCRGRASRAVLGLRREVGHVQPRAGVVRRPWRPQSELGNRLLPLPGARPQEANRLVRCSGCCRRAGSCSERPPATAAHSSSSAAIPGPAAARTSTRDSRLPPRRCSARPIQARPSSTRGNRRCSRTDPCRRCPGRSCCSSRPAWRPAGTGRARIRLARSKPVPRRKGPPRR